MRVNQLGWMTLVVAVAALSSSLAVARADDQAAALEFFERKVRPILTNHCYACHSADTNSKGGLRVDDRLGLIHGGNRGAAVVPGDPDASPLIQAVSYADKDFKMPPNEQLSAEQIADLRQWIKDGAAWPKVELPDDIGKSDADYEQLRQEHWAWQPLREVKPPAAQNVDWARDDIDRFILAKLEEQGLTPVGDANKLVLIRRVTFDLTGLPPKLDEIDAFLADSSSEALATIVDRLLASPAYGERWGRHWLDVARYAESTGSARNLPYPHAWRYRDYVIDAFNADKPYHQFVREQIAGDLLPANSPREKAEQLVATGFLALGVKDVNQRFKVRFIMDNVDEQIDTVSRAILGLTVSCARCHDHKFDPIPTADYYALAGIFRSTDLCAGLRNKMGGGGLDYYDTSLVLHLGEKPAGRGPSAEQIATAQAAFDAARKDFQAIFGTEEGKQIGSDGRPKQAAFRQKMNRAQAELLALTDPAASGEIALGVRDGKSVSDTEIRIRGEAEKLGPVVPRGFLSLVRVPDAPAINPEQSGRLELARWLTSPQNPLTSRVIVNRIWQHLLGQGLVRTVDNFGVTGDQPAHPELLDHLAGRFLQDGGSIKKLVRAIVLSHVYQLSAEAPPASLAIDPANRYLWRHSPRRLDAEEIRDAMLAAAGRLDFTRPATSPAKDFKVSELRNNGAEARSLAAAARASAHRSVYLPLLRGLTPNALQVFDFAEQGLVTGRREATTVAPQALYLLNDPFVHQQSLALAERLLAEGELLDAQRIDRAYRLLFGHGATTAEIERAAGYLVVYEAAFQESQLAAAAAKTYLTVQVVAEIPPATGTESNAVTAKPPQSVIPANPDDVDRSDAAPTEESLQPGSPKAAAWASLCQAILGTAEFRYLK